MELWLENRSLYQNKIPRFLPDSASESKVWAISQFVDLNRKKGGFAIVDGENFEQGPIAKCYFDRPVPPTFHGTWIGKTEINSDLNKILF